MTEQVYINGRFLSQRVTGIQRYAREVLNALDHLVSTDSEAAPFEFVVLAPPGTSDPGLQRIRFRTVGPFHGNLWEQSTLPWASRAGMLVSFGATGPAVKRRQLITIHDASVHAVPGSFSWTFRTWYRVLLCLLVKRVVSVMTVSEFSRSEIERHFRCPPSKLRVCIEGWQHLQRVTPDASVLTRHGLRPRRYVLAVSSPTPSKNFALVADAIARLDRPDFDVAIAGALDGRVFGRSALPEADNVKRLGYVSDGELRALYENAAVFVFPSKYEGFGLPPIEAMASGTPVIAASAGSLPEVCGSGAWLVDPSDASGLAKAIERLIDREEDRLELANRGLDWVQRYSWERCGLQNLAWIREALAIGTAARDVVASAQRRFERDLPVGEERT